MFLFFLSVLNIIKYDSETWRFQSNFYIFLFFNADDIKYCQLVILTPIIGMNYNSFINKAEIKLPAKLKKSLKL